MHSDSESTTEVSGGGAISDEANRIKRIPLDIVVIETGARTAGVIVAVMASDLDASEARAEAAEKEARAARANELVACEDRIIAESRLAAADENLETMRRWYNEHPAKDKAAELWLQSQHGKDWYIGDATEAEWTMAYEWVDSVDAQPQPTPSPEGGE